MENKSIQWLDEFVGKRLKKYVYESAKESGENTVPIYNPIKAIFASDGTIKGFTGNGEYVTINGKTEFMEYDINQTFVIDHLKYIVEE